MVPHASIVMDVPGYYANVELGVFSLKPIVMLPLQVHLAVVLFHCEEVKLHTYTSSVFLEGSVDNQLTYPQQSVCICVCVCFVVCFCLMHQRAQPSRLKA